MSKVEIKTEQKTSVPLSLIKNWDKNPKDATKEGIARLKYQIKRLKLYKPLVVVFDTGDDTFIALGGNQRIIALGEIAEEQGIDAGEYLVWVSIVDAPTDELKLEYSLSDNDNVAFYNERKTADLLSGYDDLGFLQDYNISSKQSDPVMSLYDHDRAAVSAKDNNLPVLKTEVSIEAGDVFQLGLHRLMCGDSSKAEDVAKLMAGIDNPIKLIFTSPPYNMDAGLYEDYKDNMESRQYIDFNLQIINVWKEYLKGFIFWNISYNKNSRSEFIEIMYKIIKETGMAFLELIVWNKKHALPITSKDMLTRQYEDIVAIGDEEAIKEELEMFFVGKNDRGMWFNKRSNQGITNYWELNVSGVQMENLKACFPVELPVKGLVMMTRDGDLVADPFMGSGSTLIAAEKMGRVAVGMEKDNKYCQQIIDRWEEYTGGKAEKI